METNDFGNNINGRRTLTVADIPAVFSCIHYILGRVPPIVVLETRTVRFHLFIYFTQLQIMLLLQISNTCNRFCSDCVGRRPQCLYGQLLSKEIPVHYSPTPSVFTPSYLCGDC